MIFFNLFVVFFTYIYFYIKTKKIFNVYLLVIYPVTLNLIIMPIIRYLFNIEKISIFSDVIILTYVVGIFVGLIIPSFKNNIFSKYFKYSEKKMFEKIFIIWGLITLIISYNMKSLLIEGKFREIYTYIITKSNLGALYSLSMTLLLFCILYLVKNKKMIKGFIFSGILFFYGNKTIILKTFLSSIFIIEDKNKIKKIYIILGVISVFIFLIIIHTMHYNQYGENKKIINILKSSIYYYDYYTNFTILTDKIYDNTFEYKFGYLTINNFYKYIPRIIYENKPRIYGSLLIHQEIYPQYVKVGYFPSFYEPLAVIFSDFSFLGAFLGGFLLGNIKKMMYNLYKKTDNIIYVILIFSSAIIDLETIILFVAIILLYNLLEAFKKKLKKNI